MNAQSLFSFLLVGMFPLAVATCFVLLFVTAPYGRHARKGWGVTVGNRLAWVLMESPAVLVFGLCFVAGEYRDSLAAWCFLLMWQAHYVHRSFIYPFELRGRGKRMPLLIVSIGALFNGLNGYLNGGYLYTFSGGYPADWLLDPRFLVGLALFVTGFAINRWADRTLRRLREANGSDYAIPQGGLYRWISCPNYFGEIVEWLGWAIATWSLPGLAFVVWTAANLVPRATSHHRWYREQFPDYPPERKALVPGVW